LIEVIPQGNGWAWRFICAAGRVLAYSLESFTSDHEAAANARAYCIAHWERAAIVDHRMGACR
jgi:hypothetical protein